MSYEQQNWNWLFGHEHKLEQALMKEITQDKFPNGSTT